MTNTRQMVITLFAVALVCSLILSFVYSYTAPKISETRTRMTLDGLQEVIAADEFVEVIPDTLWRALDSTGDPCGIVFRVFPQGYAGPIPITIGLDMEGVVTGVRIASAAEGMKETPGLGAKITEDAFIRQFAGKCREAISLKNDGGEIDAITAATISSRAVCKGVRQGIEKYREFIGPAPDLSCVFSGMDDYIEVIEDTLWYAVSGIDTVGLVFRGYTDGYADRIEFLVGMNEKAEITGVAILASNETPGMGELIREKKFLDEFKTGTPDAISGATVTSRSLIDAVVTDMKRFKEYLK